MKLEQQLNQFYGGREKGQQMEENLNTAMHENRELQQQLEFLQKETKDIQKYAKK